MKNKKEDMLEAVDTTIDAFSTFGSAINISVHPKAAQLMFGEATHYKGLEIVIDPLRPEDTFSVNSDIEEF